MGVHARRIASPTISLAKDPASAAAAADVYKIEDDYGVTEAGAVCAVPATCRKPRRAAAGSIRRSFRWWLRMSERQCVGQLSD